MTTKQTKHSITVGIAKMNKNSNKLVSDDVYIFRDISIKHLNTTYELILQPLSVCWKNDCGRCTLKIILIKIIQLIIEICDKVFKIFWENIL